MSQRKRRQEDRNFVPRSIEPRTRRQAELLEALNHNQCIIAVGPAGTGKTYLSTSYAAQQLAGHRTAGIVVARPIVGVGRTMGFLPGTMARKLAPWSRPLMGALAIHLGSKFEELQKDNSIEITSLEHIRGMTYDDTIMILDEAQNATPMEMKAFLTRIGEDSRVIICGDQTQSDLNTESGLDWCLQAIKAGFVPSAAVVSFDHNDIVRSKLCKEWALAFDKIRSQKDKLS